MLKVTLKEFQRGVGRLMREMGDGLIITVHGEDRYEVRTLGAKGCTLETTDTPKVRTLSKLDRAKQVMREAEEGSKCLGVEDAKEESYDERRLFWYEDFGEYRGLSFEEVKSRARNLKEALEAWEKAEVASG